MELNRSLQNHEDYKTYYQSILEEYPISNYKNYGVLYNREQSPLEQQSYMNIVKKIDPKNYSSMLTQLAQKTMKNDLKYTNEAIEDYVVNLKINLGNELVAECTAPVNNSKKTKNAFCLRVLLDDFSDFLQILFDYQKGKLTSRSFNISKSTIQNASQYSSYLQQSFAFPKDIQTKTQDKTKNNKTQSKNIISFNGDTIGGFTYQETADNTVIYNDQQKILKDEFDDPFYKIYKEFNNHYPPSFSNITYENKDNFQINFKKKYSYSDLLAMHKFQNIVKTLIKDQDLKCSTQMMKKNQYFYAKYTIRCPEKKNIEYKINYQNAFQKDDLDIHQFSEYLSLNFIKDFMPQIYKQLQQQHCMDDEEQSIEQEEQNHHIWDLFSKDQNFQAMICQQLSDNLISLKKDIQKNIQIVQLNFGDKQNFDKLCEYFFQMGYSFKQCQQKEQNNYLVSFELENKIQKSKINISLDIQSKGLFEAMLIGQAKLIEMIFGGQFFNQYVKNYVQNKQQDSEIDQLFFDQFDLQLQNPIQVSQKIQVEKETLQNLYNKIQQEGQDCEYDEILEELFEKNYEVNLEQNQEDNGMTFKCDLISNQEIEDQQNDSTMVQQNHEENSVSDFDDSQNKQKSNDLQIIMHIKTKGNKDLDETRYMKYATLQIFRYFDKELFIENIDKLSQLIFFIYYSFLHKMFKIKFLHLYQYKNLKHTFETVFNMSLFYNFISFNSQSIQNFD